MADLRDPTKEGLRATRVKEVSRAQALIDASHADSYVGGGVAVWVTGRGDLLDPLSDVNKIAKALNVDPADLVKFSAAQRVSAALAEGKWIDAAVNSLNTPGVGNIEQLDEGRVRHRQARRSGRAGAPGAGHDGRRPTHPVSMGTLESYAKATVTDLTEIGTSGDLAMMRGEIARILDALGSATGAAVDDPPEGPERSWRRDPSAGDGRHPVAGCGGRSGSIRSAPQRRARPPPRSAPSRRPSRGAAGVDAGHQANRASTRCPRTRA